MAEKCVTRLRVVFRPEREGGYSAAVPALPGCFSQGSTLEETRANIREAVEAWLAVANDRDPFAGMEGGTEQEITEEIAL